MKNNESETLTSYIQFTREQWCKFRNDTPLTITNEDLVKLRGKNEPITLQEIQDIYLPLSRLINLYVSATQHLYEVTGKFLGTTESSVPYIIGIAGSVAVGKSTSSRVLKELLEKWPNHPNVTLLSTDGFLYSNAELKQRGLMNRKGFPESYDVKKLLSFLHQAKSGKETLSAPIYSHHLYDIVPDEQIEINKPDIILIEGLNILQDRLLQTQIASEFVSSFFDFTIYIDADSETIKKWYLERLLFFYDTSFQQEDAFFHYLSEMSKKEVMHFGEGVWDGINKINLIENILPYKNKARLILWKSEDHSVQKIFLRKL